MNDSNKRDRWAGFEFFKLGPRLNRSKHFGLCVFWFLVLLFGICFSALITNKIVGSILIVGFFVAFIINVIFLKIRRLHDFDMSAWWLLLAFAPILGFFWALVIFLAPGTEGKNRFGDQPKKAAIPYILISYFFLGLLLLGLLFSYWP